MITKAAAALAVVMTGGIESCVQSCQNDFFNPTRDYPGAVLVVPATARAGDTITLDATGSEITGGVGFSPVCPKIVRFFVFDAAEGLKARLQASAVISPAKVIAERTPEGFLSRCRLADGKVQIKAPAGSAAGVKQLTVGLDVEALPGITSGPDAKPPVQTHTTAKIAITTGAGQVVKPPAPGPSTPGTGTGTGPGPGTPANEAPVAGFFAVNDPSVTGQPVHLDARQSFDRDGTVSEYHWDYNGDGNVDEISNDPSGLIADAGPAGNRKIILRVKDNAGATSSPVQLDQLVVAATTFTGGTFTPSKDEVAVDAPFDISVDDNVATADTVSLDADDDGDFDDGQPAATPSPADPPPQFTGVKFSTGGWKRIAVRWFDNGTSAFTITTHLVKVTPFANPPAAARLALRAPSTRLRANLRIASAQPVTVGRLSLTRVGTAVRGLVIRGRLRGTVRAARKGQPVPPGARVLVNALFAGTLTGTVPSVPVTAQTPAGLGTPTGKGLLLARAPKDRRTQVCLRMTQSSAAKTRYTVVGATGKARGLRAVGSFPPLLFDAASLKAPSSRVTITVKGGTPKGLSAACRALAKRLPR